MERKELDGRPRTVADRAAAFVLWSLAAFVVAAAACAVSGAVAFVGAVINREFGGEWATLYGVGFGALSFGMFKALGE